LNSAHDTQLRDITTILEGIFVIEQITKVTGGTVSLWLEDDGDAPDGFYQNKRQIRLNNVKVLGFNEMPLSRESCSRVNRSQEATLRDDKMRGRERCSDEIRRSGRLESSEAI
jgi:hypothetical protein